MINIAHFEKIRERAVRESNLRADFDSNQRQPPAEGNADKNEGQGQNAIGGVKDALKGKWNSRKPVLPARLELSAIADHALPSMVFEFVEISAGDFQVQVG